MGEIANRFDAAFRDYAVDGVPASGAHEPIKAEIRAIALPIEAGIAAAALSGTDLSAAMALVAPLLDSAESAKEASAAAAASALGSYSQSLYISETLPAIVDAQLGDAVAAATAQAEGARDAAQASAAQASLSAQSFEGIDNFYPAQAVGEAAVTNGIFTTVDDSNNLIYVRRVSGASTIISPGAFATLSGAQTITGTKTFIGGQRFATNGSRIGITDTGTPITPQALVEVVGTGTTTNGLRVSERWTGTTASPYQNNDTSLWETFNDIVSSSENYSWSISAPNAYNNIPAGIHDSGERVGVYGWASSVNIPGQYVHAGRLTSQIGVRGRAGFQGSGNPSPSGAQIDSAVGVLGEVRGDSPNALIVNAYAGRFSSADQSTPVQNNHAVFADATGGTETNFSFFGARGWLFNAGRMFVGSYLAGQAAAQLTVRAGINAIEFGNADPNGYGSTLGATASSGIPFLAFCAEANPTGNQFTTRGKLGTVIYNDLAGSLVFARLPNANGAAQTPGIMGSFGPSGQFSLQAIPTAPGYAVDGVQVVGERGAAVPNAEIAAAAPTKAEFDALVGTVNTLLARLRAHGLIA